jgi:hypothetical protein
VHHGETSQNILNVPLRNTFGTPVQFFLNVPGPEHCKHIAQETARRIVNEPLWNTRSIFFQKIQDVPKDYLIRTLQSHHLGNCEFTRHFLCWEHWNEISLENSECVPSVLGGFVAGTLSISLQCTCNVLGQETGVHPQCHRFVPNPVITNHSLQIEVSFGRSKIGPLLGEGFDAK